MMVCLTSFAQVRRRVGISSLMRMFMMVMEREMEEEREGGSSTSFSKEVPPIWRLHQSGFRRVIIWANYLSLPIGEVGESEGPTLYVPRPSKLKKKEIILAGGAGGDGGVGIGRRGDELELWRIQYYFYQSHCFFLVHLKVEVKTSLFRLVMSLSLFISVDKT